MELDSRNPPHIVENEMLQLRAENQALSEELLQCQADKEFVWSLWKRLQIANPDVTAAVAVVLQREQEKQEAKDLKVLDILRVKDERISELQRTITQQSRDLSQVLARKSEFQDKVNQLQSENQVLQERLDRILNKVQSHDKDSQSHATELQKCQADLGNLVQDKTDLTAITQTQKNRISSLEQNLSSLGSNYDQITHEVQTLKQAVTDKNQSLEDQQSQLKHKDAEVDALRRELKDLWETHQASTEHANQQAELIRQLQTLNKDTQKILTNQEDAFNMEATSLQSMYKEMCGRYQSLQATEKELQGTILHYKKQVASQKQELDKLQEQVETSHSTAQTLPMPSQTKLCMKCIEAQEETRQLKDELLMKVRALERLQGEQSMDTDETAVDRRRPCHASLQRRSLSASPCRGSGAASQDKLKRTEKKLEDMRTLLKLKKEELLEVQSAHDRRVERLKALQANYRLTKKQLAALEEEVKGPIKKKKKLRQSDPKSLQKEDSDTVWNELAYYRNECKNIAVDNVNLQEERDRLKVQVAQDRATIHELEACLEQEREELQFLSERSLHPSPTAELRLQKELEEAQERLCELQEELPSIQADNVAIKEQKRKLEGERRSLSSENMELKQQWAEHQIQITDLRTEIRRMRTKARRRKHKKVFRSDLAKHYQEKLNQSIQTMNTVFGDHYQEDSQQLTESEDGQATDVSNGTVTTQATDASLGQSIVFQARTQTDMPPSPIHGSPIGPTTATTTHRQASAEERHVLRLHQQRSASDEHESVPCLPRKSPIKFKPPGITDNVQTITDPQQTRLHVVSKKTNPLSRQLTTCRQRIQTLQREVTILRSAKNACTRRESEQLGRLNSLQHELNTSIQKLQTARFTIQRLSGDVERLQLEKDALELESSTSEHGQPSGMHSPQEWNSLQARLKSAIAEVSKQLTQIRQLKAENSTQAEKLSSLQEKICHLERDVGQKRLLVEDMKRRLQISKENAQSDADVMLEVEERLRTLAETNARYKTQVDSYKNQLAAQSTSKYETENKVLQLSQEIEKKTKLVVELQRKTSHLQATMVELEHTAQQELHALANESKAAITAIQSKLTLANAQTQEFHKFLKIFCHSLVKNVQQARLLLRKQEWKLQAAQTGGRAEQTAGQTQAHQVACHILNLSQEELQDFLSGQPSKQICDMETAEVKLDKKWSKKWEKIVECKDFAMDLVEILLEKIEENRKLHVVLAAM